MKNITIEEAITRMLGENKKIELCNKITKNYEKNYMEEYGDELESVVDFIQNIYKIIIEIAINKTNKMQYTIEFNDNIELKISLNEFYNEYKEYIKLLNTKMSYNRK